MIFQKLLTSGEIILIATIAFCTASSENDTASMENYTISMENNTDKTANNIAISYQLPYFIKPLHYDAKIRLNYKRNDIFGKCNITIHIDRQIENISIKSGTFAIFKIVFYDNRNEKIYIPRYSFFYYLNVFMINCTNTSKLLSPGKYNLIMTYMRYMNDNKKHFFNSSYTNKKPDNILKATGIDEMTARQLFPIVCSTILCWDEENFNATFKISIKHHKNYTALSNMAIKTTENDKHDMMWTHFDKSSIMLLNRLKIVITTFTNISTMTANVTFWGRESSTYYLQLAECIAQQILYYLNHENNITKLPKLDYVASWNSQHNSRKTEGLILHREHDIVHDETIDTVSHKIQVSYLISFQIVSGWYDDAFMWSKKGFLTLLATYILQKVPSYYNIMNLFTVKTQREFFLYSTPFNIKKMNLLSYPLNYIKSLNIWRTLHQMTPDNVFWIGIRTYIDQQYNQTHTGNTDDLWNIMQTVLHKYPDNSTVFIVKKLISIWLTEKYYYPILNVTRNSTTNITQFLYLIPDDIDEDRQYHPIFVTYTTKSVRNFRKIFNDKFFWLSPDKPVYEEIDVDDWIIANLKQTGYYRVNYDSINWLKLVEYMNSTKHTNIHVLNRAQIIDDAFHFLIHGKLDYDVFWKITAFLSRDTNYVAWYPMLKIFEYITVKVPIENARSIRVHMHEMLDRILKVLEYNKTWSTNDFTECLREEVLKWACIFDNKECLTEANTRMIADLEGSDNYTIVTSKRWMYCNGLKIANASTWKKFWQKWISTFDQKFLEYVTCYEDPDTIYNYLQFTTTSEYLTIVQRNTTRAHIFLFIITKHIKHDKIFDSVLKELNTYILSFTSNKQTVKIAILIVVISHQHDNKQFDEVLKFAKTDLKEMRLVDAVQKKIRNRKMKYSKLVANYGVSLKLFS